MKALEEKAAKFENFVNSNFIDNDGIVFSRLNSDTQKPWTKEDWSVENEFLPVEGFESWDVINYENSGMTTGAFLAAMSYKYLVTKDKSALKTAAWAFNGLKHIYQIGCQREEGFFPKIYGGRISHEISTDQYLYGIKGMMAYREIATPEEQKQIKHMICSMVDFWVSRGYRYTYFGIKNMLWPLGRFPALLLMAYTVSKDQKYMREFDKLNRVNEVYKHPADSQLLQRKSNPNNFSDYERKQGDKYLLVNVHECAAMDIMELDECLKHSNAYKKYWLESIRESWREGKLSLAEDGYCYFRILFDPSNDDVSIPEPEYIADESPIGWSFWRWACGLKMPRSTILARAGVNVAKWLPEEDASDVVEKILKSVTLDNICDYIPIDDKQLMDKHKFMAKMLCGDSITNWLWAYWQGRFESVIGVSSVSGL